MRVSTAAPFIVVVLAMCRQQPSVETEPTKAECDEKVRVQFAEHFHVAGELRCVGGICRVDLTADEAKEIAQHAPYAGSLECLSLAARDDARFDHGAYSAPCCLGGGGSSCTQPFSYAVSEKQRELCIQ